MSTMLILLKKHRHGVLVLFHHRCRTKIECRTVVNVSGSYGNTVASGLKCSITPKSANPTLYIICQLQYTTANFNAGYVLFDNTNAQYVLFNDQSTDAYGSTSGRKHLSSGGIGSSGFNSDGNDYGNSSRTATGKYINNNTLEIEYISIK